MKDNLSRKYTYRRESDGIFIGSHRKERVVLMSDILKEYQEFVAKKTAPGDALLHAVLGIVTEAGEIADSYKKKKFYNKPTNYVEEMGDLEFYLCMLANAIGIDIEDVLRLNMDKLNKRYKDGFTKEEAVNRADKK